MVRTNSIFGFFERYARETTLSIALFLSAGNALAEDELQQETDVRAGFGVVIKPQYEGAKSHHVLPLLSFRIDRVRRYLELRGSTVFANVINTEKLEFGPVVHFRAGRESSVENTAISQLPDIGPATEMGIFVSIPIFIKILISEH